MKWSLAYIIWNTHRALAQFVLIATNDTIVKSSNNIELKWVERVYGRNDTLAILKLKKKKGNRNLSKSHDFKRLDKLSWVWNTHFRYFNQIQNKRLSIVWNIRSWYFDNSAAVSSSHIWAIRIKTINFSDD